MPTTGFIIGHFEPFHLGQVRQIIAAAGQVEQLWVFITPHPSPNPRFCIKLKDKARWLSVALEGLPFIKLVLLPDARYLPLLLNQGSKQADFDTITTVMPSLLAQLSPINQAAAPVWFVQPSQFAILQNMTEQAMSGQVVEQNFIKPLGVKLATLPPQPFDDAAIFANPALHWQAIHPAARSSYTKTVALVGGESSGKTTLLHKLVNYYGASYALEMGRLFVDNCLGGTELGMQYDDYPQMACDHEQAIRAATHNALAPVTFVDTDFVTTQAFCEVYEGQSHPFLSACIDTFRLDYTLFLSNNTPWVADGMRSLGSDEQRSAFAQRLASIYNRHGITVTPIRDADYHQRFLQAVALIDGWVFAPPTQG